MATDDTHDTPRSRPAGAANDAQTDPDGTLHGGAASADDQPYDDLRTERRTLLVSVNSDADDESRMTQFGAHVGQGWRVIQAIAVSGDESGPGGETEDFMRYQVTVEREIDAEGVIVGGDRGGAADLADVGQVSAAFDGPLPSDESENT